MGSVPSKRHRCSNTNSNKENTNIDNKTNLAIPAACCHCNDANCKNRSPFSDKVPLWTIHQLEQSAKSSRFICQYKKEEGDSRIWENPYYVPPPELKKKKKKTKKKSKDKSKKGGHKDTKKSRRQSMPVLEQNETQLIVGAANNCRACRLELFERQNNNKGGRSTRRHRSLSQDRYCTPIPHFHKSHKQLNSIPNQNLYMNSGDTMVRPKRRSKSRNNNESELRDTEAYICNWLPNLKPESRCASSIGCINNLSDLRNVNNGRRRASLVPGQELDAIHFQVRKSNKDSVRPSSRRRCSLPPPCTTPCPDGNLTFSIRNGILDKKLLSDRGPCARPKRVSIANEQGFRQSAKV